ncbi:MAG TPA: hypothetical protein DCX54_10900 [Flavobacteriales bacterium]|nr:hypothetical protein [Flavobacteriales bacterium]
MNATLKDIHDQILAHFREKQQDVFNVMALGSNLEKWFQGEIILALINQRGAKIVSSDYLNKESDDGHSWEEWSAIVKANKAVVSVEGMVFKEKDEGRKADVYYEEDNFVMIVEIKICWLSDGNFKNSPAVDAIKKDIKKLSNLDKKSLVSSRKNKNIYKCIMLCCVIGKDNIGDLLKSLTNGIFFENYLSDDIHDLSEDCAKEIRGDYRDEYIDPIKDFYIVTIPVA